MDDERLDSALRRIDAALTRITDAADAARPQTGGGEADTKLRETVSASLAELDDLIARLEA